MHVFTVNGHLLRVGAHVVATAAAASVVIVVVFLSTERRLVSACAEQVRWFADCANHLLSTLDAVVGTIVFHRHLEVCREHPRVHTAAATHVDGAGGVQSCEHAVVALGSANVLLLNRALAERVVVVAALPVVARLHVGWISTHADTHARLPILRVVTHVLLLLLKGLRLLELLDLLNGRELQNWLLRQTYREGVLVVTGERVAGVPVLAVDHQFQFWELLGGQHLLGLPGDGLALVALGLPLEGLVVEGAVRLAVVVAAEVDLALLELAVGANGGHAALH